MSTSARSGSGAGIVVLVATTDRPESFASLASDLTDARRCADLRVTIGLVENSRDEGSRVANLDTVGRLRASGIGVALSDASPGGRAIDESRTRQRNILRSLIQTGPRPSLVWMLDDDVRLRRMVVRDGLLRHEAISDPFGALLDVGVRGDGPDVLVGTVHGDPPIPPMATWASRTSDLAANLERMVAVGRDVEWPSDDATSRRLTEPDYYYDYGHHPEVEEPAYWLPSERGQSTLDAMEELTKEAVHLPCGVGLTRPIVAMRPALDGAARLLGPAQVRGGNTAFFDIDACLAHDYPTVEVAGVRTRRSDSVGLHVLRTASRVRIASSDFAVLHQRDRDAARLPDNAEAITRHLLADSFGAALTRAVTGADSSTLLAFMRSRIERIDRSLARLQSAIDRMHRLAERAPRWALDAGIHRLTAGPDSPLSWFEACVPGLAEGRVPESARQALLSPAAAAELTRTAAACLASSAPSSAGTMP